MEGETVDAFVRQFLIDTDDCDTRLHMAAYQGNAQLIKTILKQEPQMRACINMQVRPLGATPLRLAATGGHVEAINALLENGAKVDKADVKRQTPLFIAIKRQNLECSRALLEGCANPNGDTGNLSSPLYIAAESGFTSEVMLLLEYGADPEPFRKNYTNCTGGSFPLQATVAYAFLQCFKVLLVAGAEPDLRKLRPPPPDSVVRTLSLIHSIVRHYPAISIEFTEMFVLFGGHLWQQDLLNRLATDFEISVVQQKHLKLLMSSTLKLKELCRISVRREVGRKRLRLLKTLPLPQKLLDFLLYKDVIEEDLLIYK